MIDRFHTSETGNELLRHASHLKIDLYRDEDAGGLQVHFELSGMVGQPDDNMLGGVGIAGASDLRFLAELMKKFERSDGGPAGP